MTVENVLRLLAAQPPPPMGQKLTIEQHHILTAQLLPTANIPIPNRRRHQSWSSTGSTGSGKSSPLSTSPMLNDLLFPVQGFPFPPPMTINANLKPEKQSTTDTQSHRSVNTTRYKTEMCRPFEESGHCKYGDKCQFAHGRYELRNLSRHPKYKTELCRTFHTVGFCPYGPRCHFVHSEDEAKLHEINHMKQQQVLNQVVQQVAQQQQVLSCITATGTVQNLPREAAKQLPVIYPHISNPIQMQRAPISELRHLPLPMLLSLGSTIETPPPSVADSCSPSTSPSSVVMDDVFSGLKTPPPGFGTANGKGFFNSMESTTVPKSSGFCLDLPRCETPPSKSSRSSTPLSSLSDLPPGIASPSSSPSRLPIFSRIAIQ